MLETISFFDHTAPPCKAGLDIALVVDKSSSISKPELGKAAKFLKDLVDKFNPGPDEDHFGLITFSQTPTTAFTFADSEYYDKEALKQGIDSSLATPGRGTRTDRALTAAADTLFTAAGGDRADKPNVMIVLTDGIPHNLGRPFEEFAKEIAKRFEVSILRSVGCLYVTVSQFLDERAKRSSR